MIQFNRQGISIFSQEIKQKIHSRVHCKTLRITVSQNTHIEDDYSDATVD
jgi:hypothetical protein